MRKGKTWPSHRAGRSNLLEGLAGEEDIDRVRLLFDDLERKENLIEILNLAETGSGVRIFIGSENKLFSLSGSSLIVAPYKDDENRWWVLSALLVRPGSTIRGSFPWWITPPRSWRGSRPSGAKRDVD